MSQNLFYLFKYFEKEKISLDKKEFEFQIQSHPDYPSLLSISDTLSFFNIDNGAMRIGISEIEFLPERFIALLIDPNHKTKLYFIEKNGNEYHYTNDKKQSIITKKELESKWQGICYIFDWKFL